MQKFLGLHNIVEVNTLKSNDKFTISRLNALAIIKFDANNPQERLNYFYNDKSVLDQVGISNFYEFSKIYFGFTSKSLTKAEKLGLYVWNEANTNGYLRGVKAPDITQLKKVNGKAKISIDGVASDFSVDLTGENIVSYDNVAGAIQTGLRAVGQGGFSNATCIFSIVNNGFIIGSGSTGDSSSVSGLTSPDDGTDISNLLGLSADDNIQIINGKTGLPTLSDMLSDIESINGDYYVVTPAFIFADEANDLLTFGNWIKNCKDRYLGIYLWDNANLGIVGSNATLPYSSCDGLYIDWKRVSNQNAFSSAIIASMDLSKQGGLFNINFNEASDYLNQAVSKQGEFDGMNDNKANSFYVFGEIGQYVVSYGQGHILGSISNANTYINNSFLKFQIQFSISNLLMNTKFISLRGKGGSNLVQTSLTPIFNQAVDNGLIIIDSLSNSESNIIIGAFKNSEEAISAIESTGWFIEVESINPAKQEMTLAFAYICNEPTNRIVIKSYVLGA